MVDVGALDNTDPLGLRAFSDQPGATARFATAAVDAYKRAGVMSAAEHFPGARRRDTVARRRALPSVGLALAQLGKRDLVPFAAAIRAGVPAIVISNASYVTPTTSSRQRPSRAVSTELAAARCASSGVAIADDLVPAGDHDEHARSPTPP